MLQVSNIQFHPEIDWPDYCKLPGKSFSWLKSEGVDIPDSEGIRLGKSVHTYLLKPKEFNWDYENAGIVREIAGKLKDYYIPGGVVECGITARFEYEGLYMDWRGMPDWHLKNILTIDYKVIAGDLDRYVERFLYDHQLSGYMLPTKCPDGMIVAWNKVAKKVQTKLIKPDPRWWIYQVKKHGRAIQ